jgi:hypothetical protein
MRRRALRSLVAKLLPRIWEKNQMSTTTVIVLAVAIVAIACAAFFYLQTRRTQSLHGRFGPEYERTIAEVGDRRKAESELESRAKRVERYPIRDLSPQEQERFAEAWKVCQAKFVDQPADAVREAHNLVTQAMRDRGYPVSAEFERNAADLSVEHPRVVENYRLACDIAARHERGQANTEDLRKAIVHYRALFEDLLGVHVVHTAEVKK